MVESTNQLGIDTVLSSVDTKRFSRGHDYFNSLRIGNTTNSLIFNPNVSPLYKNTSDSDIEEFFGKVGNKLNGSIRPEKVGFNLRFLKYLGLQDLEIAPETIIQVPQGTLTKDLIYISRYVDLDLYNYTPSLYQTYWQDWWTWHKSQKRSVEAKIKIKPSEIKDFDCTRKYLIDNELWFIESYRLTIKNKPNQEFFEATVKLLPVK